MLNITAHRCLATSNCLVRTLIRLRDNVITKRCQDSHSIIEKLKVQFYYCVAKKISLQVLLTQKQNFEVGITPMTYFPCWPSCDSAWFWTLSLGKYSVECLDCLDIKHMDMAASLIQRHKLKIKTRATKNLSVSYTALWLFTTLESVIEWLLRTELLNIDCWKY